MGLHRDLVILLTEARGRRRLLRKPLINVIEARTHGGRGGHLALDHGGGEHQGDGGVGHVAGQRHGEAAVTGHAAVLAVIRGQVDLARPGLDPH